MSKTAPRSPVFGWSFRRIAGLFLFGGASCLASRLGKGSKPAAGTK